MVFDVVIVVVVVGDDELVVVIVFDVICLSSSKTTNRHTDTLTHTLAQIYIVTLASLIICSIFVCFSLL